MKNDFSIVRADAHKAETELKIQRLCERAAQLEQENQRLEEALRRNSMIFEDLLTNGHHGIALTGPDRRIVRVIKGLTGVNAASLAGQPVETLVVPEDREIVANAYRELLDGCGGKIEILVRVPQADGAIVRYAATVTDMLDNPNIQGIVWNYSTCPCSESSS